MDSDTKVKKRKGSKNSPKSSSASEDETNKKVQEKLKGNGTPDKRAEGDGESAPSTPPPEMMAQPDDIDVKKAKIRQQNISAKLQPQEQPFSVFGITGLSWPLFVVAFIIRVYKLGTPGGIVFDELHYGKYAGHYMENKFFFDAQPPLGKQLIALAAYFADYGGEFKFERIGGVYDDSVPIFALRLVPVFFGSLLSPTVFNLMLELGLSKFTAVLAALLLTVDNALVIQTRYILLEGPLLFFGLFGLLCVLRFRRYYNAPFSLPWFSYLILGSASLTAAACVRYFGLYTLLLGLCILTYDFWQMVGDRKVSERQLFIHFMTRTAVYLTIPVLIYLSIFYVHLGLLYKAGPNDNIMTSAFQASLEGGLAAIVANQPVQVVHGSQVTLRHSHNRACWLHSHDALYPSKYPDDRGSSHQQQVTCYTFKDTNNWWIVKKPENDELVVGEPVEPIKDGDVIQLIHGLTSRALNSHDVASAMTPQSQEVTCYVDHNVSMPAQNLWRLELLNKQETDGKWHAVESQIRLIHVNSSSALKYSGRMLPEWGFNQYEIVSDRHVDHEDTIWNVEEHRYSRTEDKKEREQELMKSEMIPIERRDLNFWSKLYELQYKMMFNNQENVAGHMYASDPLDWPLLKRGVAYWVDSESNAQIHFVGNMVLWLSATAGLVVYSGLLLFYILRRQRSCFDIPEKAFDNFCNVGLVLLTGYFMHFLPYFMVERTLFLHHYMPAYVFKVCLLAAVIEHIHYLCSHFFKWINYAYLSVVVAWFAAVVRVFIIFMPVTYGHVQLSPDEVHSLTWRDTWDLIIHKE